MRPSLSGQAASEKFVVFITEVACSPRTAVAARRASRMLKASIVFPQTVEGR